ncbi:MAG: hypothetical protein ACI9YO_000914 [Gammaproteobacteria bacterium]|jgi:hypothetical protein
MDFSFVAGATHKLTLITQAITDDIVIVCSVDYPEHKKLTQKLGNLVCSI